MSDKTNPLGDLPSGATESPDPQVDQTTTERPTAQETESGGMKPRAPPGRGWDAVLGRPVPIRRARATSAAWC